MRVFIFHFKVYILKTMLRRGLNSQIQELLIQEVDLELPQYQMVEIHALQLPVEPGFEPPLTKATLVIRSCLVLLFRQPMKTLELQD